MREINYNNYGNKMKIVSYKDCDHIIVEFDNGYEKKTKYSHFIEGGVKSPYDKNIYNVGYLGETIIEIKSYKHWNHMLERCYSDKFKTANPCYKNVICCDEWLCYSNFKVWYDENYYEVDNETMSLDKDILVKGNKIYSPDTCIFVPQRINSLFTKADINRGNLPIGVGFRYGNYIARCAIAYNNYKNSKDIHIGTFKTPEDAFYKGYKPFKENYIKEEANRYKDKIPQKLYNVMMSYQVEITD